MTLHRLAKYFNTTIDYLLVGDDEGENEKECRCEVTMDELIAINQKSKDRLKTESIPMDYLSDSIIFEDIIDVNTSDPDKVTISLRVRCTEEIYRSSDPIEKLILNSKKISQKEFFDNLLFIKIKRKLDDKKDTVSWKEYTDLCNKEPILDNVILDKIFEAVKDQVAEIMKRT